MNIKLLTALSMALLFTACGSDSKSSSESAESQIKKKDFIHIYQHQDNCRILDKEDIAKLFENSYGFPQLINRDTLISFNKDNTQFCENYNRTFDYTTCGIFNIRQATEKSCVIGFDFKK